MACRIVDLPLKPPPTAAKNPGSGWLHAIFAQHTKPSIQHIVSKDWHSPYGTKSDLQGPAACKFFTGAMERFVSSSEERDPPVGAIAAECSRHLQDMHNIGIATMKDNAGWLM